MVDQIGPAADDLRAKVASVSFASVGVFPRFHRLRDFFVFSDRDFIDEMIDFVVFQLFLRLEFLWAACAFERLELEE